ncbi:MAG TPA: hypothetical protein DEQ45_13480 [Agrobacterium sp.]|uniref:hypothetical protein n=1 Tax=Rhizobium sp. TaxID=391 RepID=UPI000EE4D687|nr:hypothetical protein [Agrobacterium sp.]
MGDKILLDDFEWPDFRGMREQLIKDVECGRKFRCEAEEEAARLGLDPLFDRPDPTDFAVMKLPIWSIEMVMAWIIWRDADKVVRFSREFHPKWVYPRNPFDLTPELSLSGVEGWQLDALDGQGTISFEGALSSLFLELQAEQVIASGIDLETRHRTDIPAFDWYDLEIDLQSDTETILANKVTGTRRWGHVCFRRESVINCWKSTDRAEVGEASAYSEIENFDPRAADESTLNPADRQATIKLTPDQQTIHDAIAHLWPDGKLPRPGKLQKAVNKYLLNERHCDGPSERTYQRYFQSIRKNAK